MTAAEIKPFIFEYAISGMRVRADRPVDEPDATEFWDGVLTVGSGYEPEENSGYIRLNPQMPGARIYVRCDGGEILIPGVDYLPAVRALLIRNALPYASYLQRKPVLHSSAVLSGNEVLSFVAGSGAGKSTLASALRGRGYARVADDLLPCRDRGDRIVVPFTENGRTSEYVLSTVYFLTRSPDIEKIRVIEIEGSDYLRLLAANGYGDINDSSLWEYQFGFHLRLAESTDAYILEIPDDLKKLDDAVSALSGTFSERR